ncbi:MULTISPECIES: HAD family hydrolase [unclassified Pyramidobacter]|uniref:HAD family hydrolase n=1 Tax=unclassified Pyramidobacter TaxID=2632171 RepID=UPI000EA2C137|nr:HAD family hydrolase [Pyramidobacter sp. CG50-2]RKJ78252.1 ATPase P [Pyramidobacter sp. CG50-2]
MIRIEIPGRAEPLEIAHVALDYNGTVAVDGRVLESVRSRLPELLELVGVHVLTADTYGTVRAQCEPLGVEVHAFPRAGAGACKKEIVAGLRGGVACFGNGFNDIPMFDLAALSVAVLEGEGFCAALLPHADVLVRTAAEGLDLLLKPDRLRATLRN